MLVGNPVARAGNQVEIIARIIAKYVLERRILWGVVGDLRHTKVKLLAIIFCDNHCITNMNISESPEHRGKSSRTIEVSIDNGAASIAGMRASAVPTSIYPGILDRSRQIAIGQRSHLFNGSVNPDCGNAQTHRLRPVYRWLPGQGWRYVGAIHSFRILYRRIVDSGRDLGSGDGATR